MELTGFPEFVCGGFDQRPPRPDPKLVLRSTFEARRCLVDAALRALTDPKRTCRKLALHAELRARLLWPARRQTRVAGYQAEQRPEYNRAPHPKSPFPRPVQPGNCLINAWIFGN